MHAMLRMALRLGADLETAFRQVNDQLADTLPDGHFVTAFIGLLDAATHRLRFLSGGQGPILHFQAAGQSCRAYKATSFPMGAMPLSNLHPAIELTLEPGDTLVLLTDGVYESEAPGGEQFGQVRVEQVIEACHQGPASVLASRLLERVRAFSCKANQQDDITIVIVKRETGP
jgi:phosphoserine phosphatase